jgi:AAA family ATP:ADP antiporter
MRLLAGACAILIVCAILVPIATRLGAPVRDGGRKPSAAPLDSSGGFALIRRDRYLALLAALTVLLNVVNTTGEYLLSRYVVEQSHALFPGGTAAAQAERVRFVGESYSRLYSTINLVGFLLQMFVVSRLFKWLGVGRSLLIHPIVALAGYLLLLRTPSLPLMAAVKVADNSINYSLGNTAKQALWLPTSREAKYKAKQVIDSFCVRAGDVGQAGIVFAGERLALSVSSFAAVNVVLAGAWMLVVGLLTVTLAKRRPSPVAG